MPSAQQYIYYSYSGKFAQRRSYALCTPDSYETLRKWAYSLWFDIRQSQECSGFKPTAAVWLGEELYHPEQPEIDEYNERVLKVLRDEQLYKKMSSGAKDTPDVEAAADPSSSVEIESTPASVSSEREDARSIMLGDDDALDF